jgi:hypothetical protein
VNDDTDDVLNHAGNDNLEDNKGPEKADGKR